MVESHHVQLVQTTFADVFAADSDAADIFYNRLFTLAPHLREKFSDDLSAQKTSLVGALAQAFTMLDDREGLRGLMRKLGSRHESYGVSPDSYDLAGAALLHTVKSRMGSDYSEEVGIAWTVAYASIATEMLLAHNA